MTTLPKNILVAVDFGVFQEIVGRQAAGKVSGREKVVLAPVDFAGPGGAGGAGDRKAQPRILGQPTLAKGGFAHAAGARKHQ